MIIWWLSPIMIKMRNCSGKIIRVYYLLYEMLYQGSYFLYKSTLPFSDILFQSD